MGTQYRYLTTDGGPPNDGIPPGMEQPQEPVFGPPPYFLGPPPADPMVCFGPAPPPPPPSIILVPDYGPGPQPTPYHFPIFPRRTSSPPPRRECYSGGSADRTVRDCQMQAELDSLRRADAARRASAVPSYEWSATASREDQMQAEMDRLRRRNEELQRANASPRVRFAENITSHRAPNSTGATVGAARPASRHRPRPNGR
jgi:hypothetical protein